MVLRTETRKELSRHYAGSGVFQGGIQLECLLWTPW